MWDKKERVKQLKNRKGYLMVEVVFAIFIVSLALTAMVAVFSSLYKIKRQENYHAIASGLAQEGVELVRNIRDNNWKGTSTNAFNLPFPVSGYYWMDYNDPAPTNCISFAVCAGTMMVQDAYGFYGYGGGTTTPFYRVIQIAVSGDSAVVTSTVGWNVNGQNQQLQVDDTLWAWGNKE